MPNSTLNTSAGALLPQNNGGQTGTPQAFGTPTALNSFINTLPSVPNPTPPPPKTLTVVTPKLAQTDLNAKQDTTDGVASALQTQTQNKLAQSQPNTALQGNNNGGVTDNQGNANNQTQTPNQSQGQNTQQPQASTTNTAPPNSTSVTLPNGVQAFYNNDTQQLTTTDGKQLSYTNGAWIDPTTGQPPTPPGTTSAGGTTIPASGDPTTDYLNSQLAQHQQLADQASAQHQQQIQQILNGTFPLTADQQAQVAALSSQYQQLETQQQQANDNYATAVKMLGIRNGQQYAPGVLASDVNKAVSDGITKMATLDTQAAGAVASLKSGFLNNDYTFINGAYKDLTDAIDAKDKTLQAMQDNVTKAVATQTAKIQQQTALIANQTAQVNSIAQSAYEQSVNSDGTIDLNKLTAIANENGVDPQVLYGAAQKAQQQSTAYEQQNAKFASDQLQAAAQLEASKATTRKTNNDVNLANSGSNPDGTPSAATQAYVTAIQNGNATLTNVPAAQRTAVAEALANTNTTSYSPLAASRFATASNRIVSNFIQLPQYQLTANGLPYLQRIAAAEQTPGSISDQELLDSITKLNTAGNAISDAQVRLITDGQSLSDWANVLTHKLGNGGVLSTNQRSQIQTLAQDAYANYAKSYQPVYDQVTAQLTAAGIPQPFWTIPDLNDLSSQSGVTGADAPVENATPKVTGQSDQAYVESTLNAQGLKYDDVVANVPAGQKGVINNATGQIGYIPASEYDPSIYTSL